MINDERAQICCQSVARLELEGAREALFQRGWRRKTADEERDSETEASERVRAWTINQHADRCSRTRRAFKFGPLDRARIPIALPARLTRIARTHQQNGCGLGPYRSMGADGKELPSLLMPAHNQNRNPDPKSPALESRIHFASPRIHGGSLIRARTIIMQFVVLVSGTTQCDPFARAYQVGRFAFEPAARAKQSISFPISRSPFSILHLAFVSRAIVLARAPTYLPPHAGAPFIWKLRFAI